MRRPAAVLAALVLAGGLLAGAAAATPAATVDPAPQPNSCGLLTRPLATQSTPTSVGRWRAPQLARAATLIEAGSSEGVPARAQAIAVMTAMGQTRLGARSTPVPGTQGHATVEPLDRPPAFYTALLHTPRWETMPPTLAAHLVLGNANPNAFAAWWDDALRVVRATTGSNLLSGFVSTFGGARDSCRAFRADGAADSYPVPAGTGFHDAATYGDPGASWPKGNPGTDIRTACGTPVLASTAGTVHVREKPAWAGRWMVQVTGGPGHPATSYAHLARVTARDGAYVRAGDQIGEVGDLGSTTGCALNFQVRPTGPTGETANPTRWLHRNVGDGAQPLHPPVVPFVIATFNVLGDSHSHEHKGFKRGAARMPRAFALLQQHDVQVAGLQELQPVQLHVLEGLMGSAYGHYPTDERDTENSLIWRTSDWDLVEEHTISIPYFGGHPRNIPVVQLRQHSSGATAWFMNTHNPADIDISPHNAKWRAIAVAHERSEALRLLALDQGPVFFTGDMNDRQKVINGLAGALHSAGGGAVRQVDFIFGSDAVTFSGYDVDGASLRGISDHRLVVADATFDE